jgi:hypothetical protein
VEQVHGVVDRVHIASSQGPRDFIKHGSSIRWSTAWILIKRRVIFVLISIIHPRSDGSGRSFFLSSARPNRVTGAQCLPAWEGPSSSYDAPFAMRFLPTRSTRQEELILHTYGEGNIRGRASDGGAIWTTLGGGDWLLRWSSGEKNRMNRLSTFPSCSSVLQFLRAAMNWTHTARNPWRLWFGVASKILMSMGRYL